MKRYRWMKPWTLGCLVALGAPLGWPATGRAAGTWSVISLPQKPGEVASTVAITVDAAGKLYVAQADYGSGRVHVCSYYWPALSFAFAHTAPRTRPRRSPDYK